MYNYNRPSSLDRTFDISVQKKKRDITPINIYKIEKWDLSNNRILILGQYRDLSDYYKQQIKLLLRNLKGNDDLYPLTNCLLITDKVVIIGLVCYMDHEYMDTIYRNKGEQNVLDKGISCNFIYLYNLIVSSNWRKKGYAKYLLETILFFAQQRHKKGVNVQIHNCNQISQHLFMKFGFTLTSKKNEQLYYHKWFH